MKNRNEISTIDAILALFFILLCPVVALSIYQWDFSFPAWGYIIFAIAAYRIYVIISKSKEISTNTKRKNTYKEGDEIETNIVGVTFEGRQNKIEKLQIGQLILLIREPENPHDHNAIKVVAHRYSESEREAVEPSLREKYGRFSAEVIAELFAYDSIGYLSRDLAEQIFPIFDKYAIKPNQYVPAKVINLMGNAENQSRGVRIKFNLPTLRDLERAIQQEMMDSDIEYMMMRPPF